MTGPEHYREAERLIGIVEAGDSADTMLAADDLLTAAQVHALLAVAAAVGTMGSVEAGGKTRAESDDRAWRAVAGEKP